MAVIVGSYIASEARGGIDPVLGEVTRHGGVTARCCVQCRDCCHV